MIPLRDFTIKMCVFVLYLLHRYRAEQNRCVCLCTSVRRTIALTLHRVLLLENNARRRNCCPCSVCGIWRNHFILFAQFIIPAGFGWVSNRTFMAVAVARHVHASTIDHDSCCCCCRYFCSWILLSGLSMFVIVWCHQFESIARIDWSQPLRRIIVARSLVFLEFKFTPRTIDPFRLIKVKLRE